MCVCVSDFPSEPEESNFLRALGGVEKLQDVLNGELSKTEGPLVLPWLGMAKKNTPIKMVISSINGDLLGFSVWFSDDVGDLGCQPAKYDDGWRLAAMKFLGMVRRWRLYHEIGCLIGF